MIRLVPDWMLTLDCIINIIVYCYLVWCVSRVFYNTQYNSGIEFIGVYCTVRITQLWPACSSWGRHGLRKKLCNFFLNILRSVQLWSTWIKEAVPATFLRNNKVMASPPFVKHKKNKLVYLRVNKIDINIINFQFLLFSFITTRLHYNIPACLSW